MEDCHHTSVLHAAVTDNGIEDVLPVCIHISLHLPGYLLQELGNGEDGTRGQPARDIVVAQVVAQRVGRQGEDVVLQLFQVMHTSHFLHRVGITENEVAKPEMLGQHIFHVLIEFLGIFVDEGGLAQVSVRLLVGLAGIEHQGYILVHFADGLEQFIASQFVLLLAVGQQGEAAVADDTQDIVAKL